MLERLCLAVHDGTVARQPDSGQRRCEIEGHPLFPNTKGIISDEEGPDLHLL